MMIGDKEIYTPQEVADLTGVKILSVYRWIKEGKLRATKLGQWKITREDLAEALGVLPVRHLSEDAPQKQKRDNRIQPAEDPQEGSR